jgi:hypothetical protein
MLWLAVRNGNTRCVDKEMTEAKQGRDVSQAALDVLAERRRQIEAEGWTPEHDDRHDNGEMARAAACYATASTDGYSDVVKWPWSGEWWKPKDRRRNLVRAAALLLAEIERVDRAPKWITCSRCKTEDYCRLVLRGCDIVEAREGGIE